MGSNGFKYDQEPGKAHYAHTPLIYLREDAGLPAGRELLMMCRRKREEGMDTSQVERFIGAGLLASARGQAVYAQVMLRRAYDSLL